MQHWNFALTLLTAISLASAGSATTITFGSAGTAGFDGVGDLGSLVSGPVGGGISPTVVATGCAITPCIITSSSSGGGGAGFGLGLNDAGGAADGSGAPELGGPTELLTLLFSAPVTLTGFTLTDVADASNNGVIFSRSLPAFLSATNIQNLTDGAKPPGSTYDSVAAMYAPEAL